MGCCVSTHKKPPLPKHPSLEHNSNSHQFPCISKSPPRAEEEAVKEVLSETPKPKPKSRPSSRPESPRKKAADEEEDPIKAKILLLTPKKKDYLEQKVPIRDPDPDPCTPEEISEASEMCSFTESISTVKDEDDHQQLLYTRENIPGQRVYRSQGYNGNYVPHPCYNNNAVRNQGRSPARRRPESSPTRRRNPGQGGPRRETGRDNVGRRSQSPGMRGNVGRSPSARRNGPSPGRVRMVHAPKMEEKEVEHEEVRRESEEWQGPNESLENPLVSLECFIFL
ncbi:unnamed protein product [Amaranthus hypochondriacus]